MRKNILTKIVALLLATFMVVGVLPLNLRAYELTDEEKLAVDPNNWATPALFSDLRTGTRAVDAEGKPPVNWDKNVGEGKDDGSSYWPLPTGARFINAYNGSDPVNTFGFTYSGKYLDHEERVVLKFDVSHRHSVSTGFWKKYVMRLPKSLFTAVDLEHSYVVSKRYNFNGIDNYYKLSASDVDEQQAYTLQFPYSDTGAGYVRNEINLVLKKTVNWETDFANNQQVIQLRLYNKAGNTLYSTSARRNKSNLANFGYNSHTKTVVVGDLSKRPADLMESTTKSALDTLNDAFHTADSSLELDKENGKVRILYTFAKGKYSDTEGVIADEGVALRQSFDPEFVKYLDLSDKNAKIGTMQLFYSNGSEYGNRIDIHAYDLNGVKKDSEGNILLDSFGNPTYNRDDGAVFIQKNTDRYRNKDNPDATDPNHVTPESAGSKNVYFRGDTTECASMLFEYDIDPSKIHADMLKNNEFAKNFMFDTRYIMSNTDGVRKFTIEAPEDIVYQPNKKTFFRIKFDPYISLTTMLTSKDSRSQDFVLNIGGSEGIWKSWKREGRAYIGKDSYLITPYKNEIIKKVLDSSEMIGGTIKKGTPITVYVPNQFNVNNVTFDIVTAEMRTSVRSLENPVSVLGGKNYKLKKVIKKDGSDIFYTPMYIKNSVSTIGGSAIREQFVPIVDEIFTDSESFTGIMRTEGGVLSTLHKADDSNSKYLGSNWVESESDKDGKPTKYYRSDGKDPDQEFNPKNTEQYYGSRTVKGLNDNNDVVNKTFNGYLFSIKNLYTGADTIGKTTEDSTVKDMGLIKDQPVMFNTFKNTSLKSEPIYEQVQAKVKFMLYPEKSIFMERIVPLNKQYSIVPEIIERNDEGALVYSDKNVGKPNTSYVGNGFLSKQDEESQIRVDEKKPTVAIKRTSLTEADISKKEQSIEYPNFLDHDGYVYDINSTDAKIKEQANKEFIKRLFPDSEFDAELSLASDGKPRTDNKVVKGWTTRQLVDKGNNTALDQFYELEKQKKVLSSLVQWKNVDNDTEVYIFDEYSPVDKNRTVYPVWGSPRLILHANNTDAEGTNENIVIIPYNDEDKVFTDKVIDAMTSSTKVNLKKNNVIKKLPLVPYRYESKQLGETFDQKLEQFIKEGSTFVGWTMERYTNDNNSEFEAGNNNERIAEIKKGMASNGRSLPTMTESTYYMDGNRYAYVPNGYNFAVSKGFEALMKEGKDIHLYANYRPYFDVNVYPRYSEIDKAGDVDHPNGKYTGKVKSDKVKKINVGILYRTAVTGYDQPTVLQGATYNPITGPLKAGQTILQSYDGTTSDPLKWTVPGYDIDGMRQSYVAVVVPEGKQEAYNKFKQEKPNKPDEVYDWIDLGISTYVKLAGQSAELAKDAPLNLHDNLANGDPYGIGLAKQQTFSVKRVNAKPDEKQVDAYTSATSRQSVLRKFIVDRREKETKEVKGYNIILTNTPKEIDGPRFNSVKDTDKTITIKFDEQEINEKLSALKLKVPTVNPLTNEVEFKEYEFVIGADGKTIMTGSVLLENVKIENGLLTIGDFDFSNLPKDELTDEKNRTIYGTYKKVTKEGVEIESTTTNVKITKVETSYPVTNMEQIRHDEDGKARIQFIVPEPDPRNQVVKGTVYTAQKFDKNTSKWVDVGQTEVTDNKSGNKPLQITLDEKVEHDDIIRIVSKEPGKKPNYSVGDENDTEYTPETPDPQNPGKPISDYKHYVKLDLNAPLTTDAKAEDERFRRTIDLTATFNEALGKLPDKDLSEVDKGKKIKVEFGTIGPRNEKGNKVLYFNDKNRLLKEVGVVERTKEMEGLHGIWLSVVDEFGNAIDETSQTDGKVNYNQTYQLAITVSDMFPGDDYIGVYSEKENTSLTIIVKRNNQEVFTDTKTIGTNYLEIDLVSKGVAFTLQKNDIVELKATCTEGGKTYTTNPFEIIVE